MYHTFINVDQGHHGPYTYLFVGIIQQSVHETKIHDVDDLRKRLMQTCFDFDRKVINASVTI